MPRNRRKSFYNRKFDLRFSSNMADRLEGLARKRKRPLAHIVRLATERGLREMEAGAPENTDPVMLSEGQRARISGLSIATIKPEHTLEGFLAVVVKDEKTGWTYATFASDASPDVIVIKLDEHDKLQGNYILEVEEEDDSGPYWRTVNG